MISQILLQAGKDPTLFIGGRLPLIDANGRAGSGETMICEACEFKDHFLELSPAVSLILNIDADHLDYFGTLENVIRSFHLFAQKASKAVIANAEDPNTLKALEGIQQEIITFGFGPGCDWQVQDMSLKAGSFAAYDLYHKGKLATPISLGSPANTTPSTPQRQRRRPSCGRPIPKLPRVCRASTEPDAVLNFSGSITASW